MRTFGTIFYINNQIRVKHSFKLLGIKTCVYKLTKQIINVRARESRIF